MRDDVKEESKMRRGPEDTDIYIVANLGVSKRPSNIRRPWRLLKRTLEVHRIK
jgi:hypothetical protein